MMLMSKEEIKLLLNFMRDTDRVFVYFYDPGPPAIGLAIILFIIGLLAGIAIGARSGQ